MTHKIAIQGIKGCFHDAAAHEYFNIHRPDTELEIVECDTFDNMFERLESEPDLIGIVAIENTIAGALLQNHELLRRSRLLIAGEHKMRISHVLCALPGSRIDDIFEVNSHPMALMQCERFLHEHPRMKKSETFDTAGSASMIASRNLAGHGAICGEYAAELYGLEILQKEIETNKRNFTRFLIVANPSTYEKMLPEESKIDKASIVFTLPHVQGALSKVLAILTFYDMNLTKIQSMPIIGREWEYLFYVDITFDSYKRYVEAIDAVKPLMSEFRSLGEYPATPL